MRTEKANHNRKSKKQGEVDDYDCAAFDPNAEEDLFVAVDAGQGDEFMAVKPWIGAIVEPSEHADPNPALPKMGFELEYVFGYRCEDVR